LVGRSNCEALASAKRLELWVDGVERTAEVQVAPTAVDDKRAAPLVIILHGLGGTGLTISLVRGLTEALDDAGYVGVFPDALTGEWHFPGYSYSADPSGQRKDSEFFEVLLGRLTALDCVDPHRVYLAGISMGGGMATEITCRHAHRIAAVGLVAAQHFAVSCPQAQPVAVMSLHAVDDDVLPYKGGHVGGAPVDFPQVQAIRDVFEAWGSRNQCRAPGRPIELRRGVTRLSFEGCTRPVVHLRLAHGGHTWFGDDERHSGISATQELLDFFNIIGGPPAARDGIVER